MKRTGKDFSGKITPLFDTMMVQPVEEMGEDSDNPTDSTPIPIIDQPSSSSQPKKDKLSKKVQRQEAEVPKDEAEHVESVLTPSCDPQPSGEDSIKLTDLMVLCTKLQTHVLGCCIYRTLFPLIISDDNRNNHNSVTPECSIEKSCVKSLLLRLIQFQPRILSALCNDY
ncbi:hypothetical protein Tco_0699067 [Tanacetum coccineum]